MTPPSDSRLPRRWLPIAAVTALFGTLTALFTYPLWLRPTELLTELMDVRLTTWIMAWDAHALVSQPGRLFDANIFHPHARALAFSENLLGSAILVAPINWLGEPVLAYNTVLLSSFVLCGVAATFWVRHLTGSIGAGIVAGVVWAFGPPKMAHLAHIQLLAGAWIVLALLALTRYAETRRRGYMLLAGALIGWQYLAGIQYTLLLLPFVAIYFGALLLASPDGIATLFERRFVIDIALGALLTLAVVVPVSRPYFEASRVEGFARDEAEVLQLSAQPNSLLAPSAINSAPHMKGLYARFDGPEGNSFPGVVAALLLVAGLVAAARRKKGDTDRTRPWVASSWGTVRHGVHMAAVVASLIAAGIFLVALLAAARGPTSSAEHAVLQFANWSHPAVWLAIAAGIALLTRTIPTDATPEARLGPVAAYLILLGFLLSLGPIVQAWGDVLGAGPYRLLYTLAMPYESIRAVGRFGLPMLLFVALAVGLTTSCLQRSLRLRFPSAPNWVAGTAFPAILVPMMLLDYGTAPLEVESARLPDEVVYSRIADLPGDGAVLHLPMIPDDYPPAVTEYMFGSTRHWKPLVNGFSGFLTGDMLRLAEVEPFSRAFVKQARNEFNVDYIVVHGHLMSGARFKEMRQQARNARSELAIVERVGTTIVYRLRQHTERGPKVYYRWALNQLDPPSALTFEARSVGRERETMLEVTWNGLFPVYFPLTPEWRTFTVPLAAGQPPRPNGAVWIQWQAIAEDRPLGTTGQRVRGNISVDVQPFYVGLAFHDQWITREPEGRTVVAVFSREARELLEWQVFETTLEGFRGAAQYIEAALPGTVIAVGYTADDRPASLQDPALAAALRSIGSAISVESMPPRLAIVGVKLAPPGSATESRGGSRANIRVGPPTRNMPLLAIRNIRRKQPLDGQ